MPTPSEHKTVQARILAYAEAIGWTFVPREKAEQRRGFGPQITQIYTDSEKNNLRSSAKSADTSLSNGKDLSLFFVDLLDANVREFNPRKDETITLPGRAREWVATRIARHSVRLLRHLAPRMRQRQLLTTNKAPICR